ncbi:Holo-[acyl-carrier-protein] synthase [Gemmata obscuriglobus]|uniref:Holo-[acyl-carrier-protein] synthase n=1 Tax=Gemmata obscuriglobus TaxID=114 RepID=A0A2Z3H525_9BACT|nr:holo-ACP synthase [Gemmata obscuriglobus]AWM39432.1 holo-ACP synthase [Gemmata obscuriglobus]QEG27488.1 Holo-[acyl-carrier-protein] synthase [Gemmata obscuriglobus]VTS04495.1 holo-(acyl-carrier-protein) synthase : Holo-[acyl-carrier-protein] synthase OS=Singulisphaera acidiphila (strain ATCC BAA-1392 / DSM 18658 / VKM B-2454 / MOB10) GN=acpS PE=3 SV=1: ACPS [Gemmata obscuriglobus UQM 2246]
MEILGLGTQVLECARVRQLLDEHADAFLRQVYTDREVRFCHSRRQTTEQFAALWAAKEAVLRALGTTWKRGMSWTDVEVLCEPGQTPRAVVIGAVGELQAARGVNQVLLTMAFCRSFATATAIAGRVAGPPVQEDTALDD